MACYSPSAQTRPTSQWTLNKEKGKQKQNKSGTFHQPVPVKKEKKVWSCEQSDPMPLKCLKVTSTPPKKKKKKKIMPMSLYQTHLLRKDTNCSDGNWVTKIWLTQLFFTVMLPRKYNLAFSEISVVKRMVLQVNWWLPHTIPSRARMSLLIFGVSQSILKVGQHINI